MTYDPHRELGVDPIRVRGLRHARGWTIQFLADRAGLTRTAIGRLEGGHRGCQYSTLEALAAALDVPVDSLLRHPTTAPSVPPLAPRLHQLLDEYDHTPRGTADAMLAALVRATISAHSSIGLRRERDHARVEQARAS